MDSNNDAAPPGGFLPPGGAQGREAVDGIKVRDVADVSFAAPDLALMRGFLEDFGLVAAPGSSDDVLYMKGAGAAPFLHRTHVGPLGVSLEASCLGDLEHLARCTGAPIAEAGTPGGGYELILTDPDNIAVSVVAERAPMPAVPPAARAGWNDTQTRRRVRAVKRVPPSPSQVVRLGHVVLSVTDFRGSERWWKDRFGFITSDEIQAPNGFAFGAFMRCDRGEEPTDHHSLFLVQMPGGRPGFHHAAFEVRDLDDLMAGHNHLQRRQHRSAWGVGRHTLGSQVFDYWLDPWGRQLEHWTDGDLFTAEDAPRIATVEELMGTQWGPATPSVHP